MGNPAFLAALTADAAIFAAGDFSSAVTTAGGSSVRGTLSGRDAMREVGGSVVQTRETVLLLRATDAALIADRSVITVDGTSYRVDFREPLPPDGRLVHLILVGGGA